MAAFPTLEALEIRLAAALVIEAFALSAAVAATLLALDAIEEASANAEFPAVERTEDQLEAMADPLEAAEEAID